MTNKPNNSEEEKNINSNNPEEKNASKSSEIQQNSNVGFPIQPGDKFDKGDGQSFREILEYIQYESAKKNKNPEVLHELLAIPLWSSMYIQELFKTYSPLLNNKIYKEALVKLFNFLGINLQTKQLVQGWFFREYIEPLSKNLASQQYIEKDIYIEDLFSNKNLDRTEIITNIGLSIGRGEIYAKGKLTSLWEIGLNGHVNTLVAKIGKGTFPSKNQHAIILNEYVKDTFGEELLNKTTTYYIWNILSIELELQLKNLLNKKNTEKSLQKIQTLNSILEKIYSAPDIQKDSQKEEKESVQSTTPENSIKTTTNTKDTYNELFLWITNTRENKAQQEKFSTIFKNITNFPNRTLSQEKQLSDLEKNIKKIQEKITSEIIFNNEHLQSDINSILKTLNTFIDIIERDTNSQKNEQLKKILEIKDSLKNIYKDYHSTIEQYKKTHQRLEAKILEYIQQHIQKNTLSQLEIQKLHEIKNFVSNFFSGKQEDLMKTISQVYHNGLLEAYKNQYLIHPKISYLNAQEKIIAYFESLTKLKNSQEVFQKVVFLIDQSKNCTEPYLQETFAWYINNSSHPIFQHPIKLLATLKGIEKQYNQLNSPNGKIIQTLNNAQECISTYNQAQTDSEKLRKLNQQFVNCIPQIPNMYFVELESILENQIHICQEITEEINRQGKIFFSAEQETPLTIQQYEKLWTDLQTTWNSLKTQIQKTVNSIENILHILPEKPQAYLSSQIMYIFDLHQNIENFYTKVNEAAKTYSKNIQSQKKHFIDTLPLHINKEELDQIKSTLYSFEPRIRNNELTLSPPKLSQQITTNTEYSPPTTIFDIFRKHQDNQDISKSLQEFQEATNIHFREFLKLAIGELQHFTSISLQSKLRKTQDLLYTYQEVSSLLQDINSLILPQEDEVQTIQNFLTLLKDDRQALKKLSKCIEVETQTYNPEKLSENQLQIKRLFEELQTLIQIVEDDTNDFSTIIKSNFALVRLENYIHNYLSEVYYIYPETYHKTKSRELIFLHIKKLFATYIQGTCISNVSLKFFKGQTNYEHLQFCNNLLREIKEMLLHKKPSNLHRASIQTYQNIFRDKNSTFSSDHFELWEQEILHKNEQNILQILNKYQYTSSKKENLFTSQNLQNISRKLHVHFMKYINMHLENNSLEDRAVYQVFLQYLQNQIFQKTIIAQQEKNKTTEQTLPAIHSTNSLTAITYSQSLSRPLTHNTSLTEILQTNPEEISAKLDPEVFDHIYKLFTTNDETEILRGSWLIFANQYKILHIPQELTSKKAELITISEEITQFTKNIQKIFAHIQDSNTRMYTLTKNIVENFEGKFQKMLQMRNNPLLSETWSQCKSCIHTDIPPQTQKQIEELINKNKETLLHFQKFQKQLVKNIEKISTFLKPLEEIRTTTKHYFEEITQNLKSLQETCIKNSHLFALSQTLQPMNITEQRDQKTQREYVYGIQAYLTYYLTATLETKNADQQIAMLNRLITLLSEPYTDAKVDRMLFRKKIQHNIQEIIAPSSKNIIQSRQDIQNKLIEALQYLRTDDYVTLKETIQLHQILYWIPPITETNEETTQTSDTIIGENLWEHQDYALVKIIRPLTQRYIHLASKGGFIQEEFTHIYDEERIQQQSMTDLKPLESFETHQAILQGQILFRFIQLLKQNLENAKNQESRIATLTYFIQFLSKNTYTNADFDELIYKMYNEAFTQLPESVQKRNEAEQQEIEKRNFIIDTTKTFENIQSTYQRYICLESQDVSQHITQHLKNVFIQNYQEFLEKYYQELKYTEKYNNVQKQSIHKYFQSTHLQHLLSSVFLSLSPRRNSTPSQNVNSEVYKFFKHNNQNITITYKDVANLFRSETISEELKNFCTFLHNNETCSKIAYHLRLSMQKLSIPHKNITRHDIEKFICKYILFPFAKTFSATTNKNQLQKMQKFLEKGDFSQIFNTAMYIESFAKLIAKMQDTKWDKTLYPPANKVLTFERRETLHAGKTPNTLDIFKSKTAKTLQFVFSHTVNNISQALQTKQIKLQEFIERNKAKTDQIVQLQDEITELETDYYNLEHSFHLTFPEKTLENGKKYDKAQKQLNKFKQNLFAKKRERTKINAQLEKDKRVYTQQKNEYFNQNSSSKELNNLLNLDNFNQHSLSETFQHLKYVLPNEEKIILHIEKLLQNIFINIELAHDALNSAKNIKQSKIFMNFFFGKVPKENKELQKYTKEYSKFIFKFIVNLVIQPKVQKLEKEILNSQSPLLLLQDTLHEIHTNFRSLKELVEYVGVQVIAEKKMQKKKKSSMQNMLKRFSFIQQIHNNSIKNLNKNPSNHPLNDLEETKLLHLNSLQKFIEKYINDYIDFGHL